MTAALTFSALCRVGSIVWLTYEGDEFEMLMYDSALYNSYSMPLYLTAQYGLMDFLSSGVLLLNFGFTMSKKKMVYTKTTQENQIKMKRRETFLQLYDSDDEDEEHGSKENLVVTASDPFKFNKSLTQQIR